MITYNTPCDAHQNALWTDLIEFLLAVPGVVLEVGGLVRLGVIILQIEIIPGS